MCLFPLTIPHKHLTVVAAAKTKNPPFDDLETLSLSPPRKSSMGAIDLSFSQSLLFSPSRSNPPSSTHRPVSYLPPVNKSRCLPPLRSMSHDDDDAASKEVKLWGGRFEESVTEKVEKFTESISFDKVLYKQDIMGSKAHATMLAHQVLLCFTWCIVWIPSAKLTILDWIS